MAKKQLFPPAVKLTFAGGSNHNEDQVLCQDQPGVRLLAAFDGCGGVGSRRYPHLNNHTSAYLASALYASSLKHWFAHHACALPDQHTAENLTAMFSDAAKQYHATHLHAGFSAVTGSMVRTLPSTAMIALLRQQRAALYWAGDTRGYLLTEHGLRQLTEDDLTNPCDGFDSLYADAPICNYLCADRSFVLHEIMLPLPPSGILVIATDGAFHTMPTPMHFEALLLDTLLQSADQKQWKKLLKEALSSMASDDVTLLLQPFGFASHAAAQACLHKRQQHVQQAYILPAAAAQPDNRYALRSLWEMYQKE